MSIIIRKGEASDCTAIYQLIHELAVFVKAEGELKITPEILERDGFSNPSFFQCFVAEMDSEIVGVAVYYPKYSTWKGKALYLEDLVVSEHCRGKGIGSMLFEELMRYAKDWGAARLEWQVYDWNDKAKKFYKKYKTDFQEEWVNCYLLHKDL